MQNEIKSIRNEYKRQKRLENYNLNRPLYRPKTKKWEVVMSWVLLLLLLFFVPWGFSFIGINTAYKIIICITLEFLIIEIFFRSCLIIMVKCYQHYAKETTRRRCKCIPSCSEYAVLSLKKIFPLLLALLKIRKRLFYTCKEEYKIDFPNKKTENAFENILQ